MNTPQSLPAYTDAALANLDTDELIELLARDEDRVPRNVIDECARRGDKLLRAHRRAEKKRQHVEPGQLAVLTRKPHKLSAALGV